MCALHEINSLHHGSHVVMERFSMSTELVTPSLHNPCYVHVGIVR